MRVLALVLPFGAPLTRGGAIRTTTPRSLPVLSEGNTITVLRDRPEVEDRCDDKRRYPDEVSRVTGRSLRPTD